MRLVIEGASKINSKNELTVNYWTNLAKVRGRERERDTP